MSEELRETIKAELLKLLQFPENIIHGQNSYEQLILIACLFVRFDFPAKWP
jgi:hypothetical protein